MAKEVEKIELDESFCAEMKAALGPNEYHEFHEMVQHMIHFENLRVVEAGAALRIIDFNLRIFANLQPQLLNDPRFLPVLERFRRIVDGLGNTFLRYETFLDQTTQIISEETGNHQSPLGPEVDPYTFQTLLQILTERQK